MGRGGGRRQSLAAGTPEGQGVWFLAKERKLSSNWDLEVSASWWLVCLLAL